MLFFGRSTSCLMPNKKSKGFRRSNGTATPSSSPPQSNRSSIRKQWTDQQMQSVIDDVLSNRLKPTEAAARHGVPRSTLKDRLSGRVVHGTKPGPKPYLTATEEEELTGHLINAANMGFGKTRRDVLSIVERHVEQKEDVSLRAAKLTYPWLVAKVFKEKSLPKPTIRRFHSWG